MSQLDLYADLTAGKLVAKDGGSVSLPAFVLGDQLQCQLRLLTRTDTDVRETDLFVRSLRVSVGKTLEPPTGGGFDLRLPDPDNAGEYFTTTVLPLAAADSDVTAQLTSLFAHVDVAVADLQKPAPGCWLFSTDAATYYNLQGGLQNTLDPVSFVRVRPFQQGTKWWYEIRLIQAPLAFSSGLDRVLPPQPTISRIRAGAAATSSSPEVNELQDLYLSNDFRGTYFFRWNYRASRVIGYQDGASVVADALNSMFGDDSKRFSVTVGEIEHGYIEFVGPLAGEPQPLITTEVHSYPQGTMTFDLPLDRAELAAALRVLPSLDTMLEIEIEVVEDQASISNPAAPGRFLTLCQQGVRVVREQIWKELATVQKIDFQRPTSPRTYLPSNPSQLIPGQQHYPATIGDGDSTDITVDHDLGTKLLAGPPMVYEVATGRMLALNLDFGCTIESENSVTFHFAVAPAADSLEIVITTAGPVSSFINDLHIDMAQVDELLDALGTINGRLDTLEDLVVTDSLLLVDAATSSRALKIPDAFFLFPNRRLPATFDPATMAEATAAMIAALPRPPGLLPAAHDATITEVSDGVFPTPTAGNVYKNTGAAEIKIPSKLGLTRAVLKPNAYAAHDGRAWYRATRAGSTNSFFPTDFELQLFPLLDFQSARWNPGQNFTLSFHLATQLFKATTSAQWDLVLEWGTAPSQSTPDPTAENLENIVWSATPLLTQRLIVSGLNQSAKFGCIIKRSATNVMSAQKLIESAYSVADSCPTTPSFVFRVRLINWDTENSIAGAVGFAFAAITEVEAKIS